MGVWQEIHLISYHCLVKSATFPFLILSDFGDSRSFSAHFPSSYLIIKVYISAHAKDSLSCAIMITSVNIFRRHLFSISTSFFDENKAS